MSGSRARDQRFVIVLALLGCSTAVEPRVPSAQVVADLRGRELTPLAAGAGFVLTGRHLTAWRPKALSDRRSASDQPAAIAVAADGSACATAAVAPTLGLRSYRLPGLEPVAARVDVCNDRVDISADGKLVACVERREDLPALKSFVRIFTFPALEPVQSIGPFSDSMDALSFVGATNRLALVTTLLDRSSGAPTFRTRLDLYDPRSGALIAEFSRPGRFPYVAFAARADVFIWAGEEGAEAWSARSFVKVRRFDATSHAIAVALSPNGHAAAVSRRGGDGEIQIFDTRSGERHFGFGSAELHAAVNADDAMALPVAERVQVGFVFLGAAPGQQGRVVIRDWFTRPDHVAELTHLAFADEQTLASTGHAFLAIWTLPRR
jgi:hypothetical protein